MSTGRSRRVAAVAVAVADEGIDLGEALASSKLARLGVAAIVAPSLRINADRAKRRRVGRVGPGGDVVGYTTLAKVQEKVLESAKVELAVEGARPTVVPCAICGVPAIVRRRAKVELQRCPRCARPARCEGCGKDLVPHVARRQLRRSPGAPLRCRACYLVAVRANADPSGSGCSRCGTELSRTVVNYSRRRGKPPTCRSCYRGEARREASKRGCKPRGKAYVVGGVERTIVEWSRASGVTVAALRHRLSRGKTMAQAIEEGRR